MDRESAARDKEAYSCYNQAGFIPVSFRTAADTGSSRAYCMEKVGKQKAVRGQTAFRIHRFSVGMQPE